MTTPCYIYDTALLQRTLRALKAALTHHPNYEVHYAVKANDNPDILHLIAQAGLGADCVSGGEIQAALEAGFPASGIVYAGVGKADWEILLALEAGIQYFNVESEAELDIIDLLACEHDTTARVCFRINPDVRAHTHANITTGSAENKFGIARSHVIDILRHAQTLGHIEVCGLHYHIGSQIQDMADFRDLALAANDIQQQVEQAGFYLPVINVGGGLGVDYDDPSRHPIAPFSDYFETFARHLHLRTDQRLHFELGRAIVAQMGTLLTRVLYIKEGEHRSFAIVDAGMSDLIRPALYGARHKVEGPLPAPSLVGRAGERPAGVRPQCYDIVGPICESSDVFVRDYPMPLLHRGDLLAIRSVGAYGRVMASTYNHRSLPPEHLIP